MRELERSLVKKVFGGTGGSGDGVVPPKAARANPDVKLAVGG
ncbi:hypothetical protein [Pseudoalteromonas sp. MMG005]|nr:hypothetical protein [Pseudoalteromonas sp. MMG005]